MTLLKNDLLLRALRKEKVERPPVWMMRQAGRYLPDYIKLREKYDFFTRVQTPALATEITLQPVNQIGVDAAIIFSDILVIPQALGLKVLMEENKGPVLPKTIITKADIDALETEGVEEKLSYVMQALSLTKSELNGRVPLIGFAGAPWTIFCYMIEGKLSYVMQALSLTKSELNGRVPLIGFAGAPWTIFCYMIEGKGSKTWEKAKQFAYTQPLLAHELLQKITTITIAYLKAQVKAGADTLQVFDSWSGALSPADFKLFAQPYLIQIADALKDDAPVILFPKGSWYALKDLSNSSAAGLGIDWCVSPEMARELTGNKITLQGNFDPAKLLAPIPEKKRFVIEMINSFGAQNYIANLGHGITPNIPVDHARAFVDAVKEYSI